MTKSCRVLLVVILLFSVLFSGALLNAIPVNAVNLLALQINEELIPGENPVRLTVTGVYSNGVKQMITSGLVWTSSDKAIATVDSMGTVCFTGEGGSVTIAVSHGGAGGSKTVTVTPWAKSVEIETTLVYSENPYRLVAKGRFSDGKTRYFGPEDRLLWSTSNPWVAWVNSQGAVTFTGEEGTVVIKVIADEYHDEVQTTVETGKETIVWRKGIKIKEEIAYSSEKQKLTLCAVMTDDSEEVIPGESADWYSDNPEVATINGLGELTFTGKAGPATIKVVYGGYKYETVVKVSTFLTKLALNQSLNYTPFWAGIELPLTATATYNDGTEIIQSKGLTWMVNDQKLAEISADGRLTFSGEAGILTVTVSGAGVGGTVVKDELTVEIPAVEKPLPKRLLIGQNPVDSGENSGIYQPQATCIYSNGERRDVTEHVAWTALTPQTAVVYNKVIYLSPRPGKIELMATFQGLSEKISAYTNFLPGYRNGRIYQLKIKEHQVPFSFKPVQLTVLAVQGDGSVKDVTAQLNWHSGQPQVATVKKGLLTFTGRIGKATITAQGFGLREQLEIEVHPEDLLPRVEQLVLEGTLQVGANQLKAVAYFSNGLVKDVTAEAVWNCSNKNIAIVSSRGTVMFPHGMGSVTVSVCYGGKEATVSR